MGLSVHPYLVKRRSALRVLAALVAALLVALPAHAQQRRHELIKRADRSAKGTGYGLLSTARVVPLSVDIEQFHRVASSGMMLAGVPITAERSVDLDLREFSVITSESVITYSDDLGRHPMEPVSVRTYRGKVAGEASSDVYLAIADHSIIGTITSAGITYQLSTDFSAPKRTGELAAVSFPTSDLPDQKFACGLKDQPFSKDELESFHAAEGGLMEEGECPTIEWALKGAFDADYEFYQEWSIEGGREGAISYIIGMIGGMSLIYERDAGVQIQISMLNIWTTPADPYTVTGFMPIALDEAKNFWGGAFGTVERGFGQVLSAKAWSGIIGIANGFNLICDPYEAITFQQVKKWDPIGGIVVLAHEAGHLMGLRHTHSCTWNPHIDECAAAESGDCFSGTRLTEGTIMSYCKQKRLVIHERQIPYLRTRVPQWTSCMQEGRKLEISKTLLHYPVVDMGNEIDTTFEFFFVNHSIGDVNVTRMVLQGDVYEQFELISPVAPFVVKSCDSMGLRLKFKATKDTTHRALLYIFHDGLNVNYGREQAFIVDVEAFAKNDVPAFGFRAEGAGRINFGKVKVDAVVDSVFRAPKELYINIGTAPLRVDSTAIIGPDRLEFELLAGSAPFVLAPFEKHPATIRFSPKTPGQKQAWLKVWSNSPGNEIDSLSLVGEALRGPVLELRVANFVIDFGDVLTERTYDTSFQDFFYNNGTEPLSINAGIGGEDAALFPGTQWLDELAPGEGMPLDIAFFAEDSVPHGWKTAMILIATNTPKGLDTVRVTAKVVGSAAAPGAEPSETAMFMIVPNPTPGGADIYIAPAAGELGRDYTLSIVDGSGREMRRMTGRFTTDGIRTSIARGELPSGVYYVSVTTDKGVRSHAITVAR